MPRLTRTAYEMRTVLAAAAVLSLTPGVVMAQDSHDTPSALQPLKACRTETDATARLACYDKVAGEILSASEAGDLRVVDREDVKKTRRSLFGFALPDLGIFGKDDDGDKKDAEEFDVLNTTISSVVNASSGGYLITTAEGALWWIDNPPRRFLSPKVGQSLEIRNAALTSYFLSINGQIGVKGNRVR